MENIELQEKNNNVVTAFDKSKRAFIPDLNKCVYSEHNVDSAAHVSPVIVNVPSCLVNHDRLPSTSTIDKNIDREVLSQKQVGETFPEKPTSHCILTRLRSLAEVNGLPCTR